MNVKEILAVLPTDANVRIQLDMTGQASAEATDMLLFEGSVWSALTSERGYLDVGVLRVDPGETILIRCMSPSTEAKQTGGSVEELVAELREMMPKPVDYAEMVGAPAWAYGYESVYDDPVWYLVEDAITRLVELDKELAVFRAARGLSPAVDDTKQRSKGERI